MVYVKWVINTKCKDLLGSMKHLLQYCVDGAEKGAEFIHKELAYVHWWDSWLLTSNHIWRKADTAEPLETIIISDKLQTW